MGQLPVGKDCNQLDLGSIAYHLESNVWHILQKIEGDPRPVAINDSQIIIDAISSISREPHRRSML